MVAMEVMVVAVVVAMMAKQNYGGCNEGDGGCDSGCHDG